MSTNFLLLQQWPIFFDLSFRVRQILDVVDPNAGVAAVAVVAAAVSPRPPDDVEGLVQRLPVRNGEGWGGLGPAAAERMFD